MILEYCIDGGWRERYEADAGVGLASVPKLRTLSLVTSTTSKLQVCAKSNFLLLVPKIIASPNTLSLAPCTSKIRW